VTATGSAKETKRESFNAKVYIYILFFKATIIVKKVLLTILIVHENTNSDTSI